MNKYLSQLRPTERRLVIGVGVVLVILLNWAFVWPYLSDFGKYRDRLDTAGSKLKHYQSAIAEVPALQKKLKAYETEGQYVQFEDQGVNFIRTIQMQSAQSGVQLLTSSQPHTQTNDLFFFEQIQNINVLAPEANLVDFLYKLGNDASMIRVRDLSLQPDPPRQRLSAEIRLVASYQKSPKSSEAKNATAKAK